MTQERRSLLVRYGMAMLAVALVCGVRLAGWSVLGDESPFLLFVLAVVVSAWYGGLRPGLLTTGLSALVVDYFFLEPYNALAILNAAQECRSGSAAHHLCAGGRIDRLAD